MAPVLCTVLHRVGFDFNVPWRYFETFYNHWKMKRWGADSWPVRRDLLDHHFQPVASNLISMVPLNWKTTVSTSSISTGMGYRSEEVPGSPSICTAQARPLWGSSRGSARRW